MGREVGVAELEEANYQMLKKLTTDFAAHFGYNVKETLKYEFLKLFPYGSDLMTDFMPIKRWQNYAEPGKETCYHH